MTIQDNVLRAYLKNVYFISGTPLGGKTTVSRALARRHGIALYSADERFPAHRRLADPELQRAMCQEFADADEFFGRTADEYANWLARSARDQLDFMLMELIQLAQDGPVMCDCCISPGEADRLAGADRVAFLIREPLNILDDYCSRPDHKGFAGFLNSASDPERARRTAAQALYMLNKPLCDAIRRSRYFYLERTDARPADETARLVARHFKL